MAIAKAGVDGCGCGAVGAGALAPFDSIDSLGTSASGYWDDEVEGVNPKPLRCPNSRGSVKFVKAYYGRLHVTYKGSHVNLTCKQWSCPVCREKNMEILWKRLWAGGMYAEAQRLSKLGIRYALKMLTLTLPGADYRKTHSPLEAAEDLSKAWHATVTRLRQIYGKFYYFCVVELQSDGYPHMHLLLVGEQIVPKALLLDIKRIWCDKCGMGFVKLRSRRWTRAENGSWKKENLTDPANVIKYMTKYMTKDLVVVGKWKKLFRASKGALAPMAEIADDKGIAILVQPQGTVIQDEDPECNKDGRCLFVTNDVQEMWALVDKHFDVTEKIIHGSAAADVVKRLELQFPGDCLPKVRTPSRRGKFKAIMDGIKARQNQSV